MVGSGELAISMPIATRSISARASSSVQSVLAGSGRVPIRRMNSASAAAKPPDHGHGYRVAIVRSDAVGEDRPGKPLGPEPVGRRRMNPPDLPPADGAAAQADRQPLDLIGILERLRQRSGIVVERLRVAARGDETGSGRLRPVVKRRRVAW